MSHFSVAVFTDENTTVEDLLEPFYEGIEVEKYIDGGIYSTYNPKSKWDWYGVGRQMV